MFGQHRCNIKPIDSFIRFILGTLVLFYALHFSYYYLIIPSLIFYYTAYTKFCFTYYFLQINQRFSLDNFYLTFLPKNNPSPVFIFDNKGEILFQNEAASQSPECNHFVLKTQLENHKHIIENNLSKTIVFHSHDTTYQIQLQGIAKENFLLAYFTDVSEIVELNVAIEDTQREVIYAMGEIGESRSKETGQHVKRVATYSKLLAKLYGLSEDDASMLKMASPMHDIGKVGIPDAILNAPRKLSEDEFKIMKTHAQLGYEMLKSSNKDILKAAAIVAHEHHEKWDGSGYPRGLSGEDIHIYGRITAIADVFDALGSDRAYKKAWELDRILKLFKEQSGKHFDPKLIELFLNNLDSFLDIRDRYQDLVVEEIAS